MEHIQLIMNDAHRLLLLQFALSISHGKSTKYKTNRAFKQVYLLLVIEYLYTYRFKIQNGSEVYKKKISCHQTCSFHRFKLLENKTVSFLEAPRFWHKVVYSHFYLEQTYQTSASAAKPFLYKLFW